MFKVRRINYTKPRYHLALINPLRKRSNVSSHISGRSYNKDHSPRFFGRGCKLSIINVPTLISADPCPPPQRRPVINRNADCYCNPATRETNPHTRLQSRNCQINSAKTQSKQRKTRIRPCDKKQSRPSPEPLSFFNLRKKTHPRQAKNPVFFFGRRCVDVPAFLSWPTFAAAAAPR